jgi:spermidine/putrescine transport system permease protein
LAVFFILPFYVIVSVAFGTVDFFRNPLPIYQPWYWDLTEFRDVLSDVFGGVYTGAYVRTFGYVAVASALCLLIGYTVAYFVARYGGRRKTMFLVLLITPFWISYLMRMFAWQSLLTDDGWVNDVLLFLNVVPRPVGWLEGRSVTVILGLVYGYLPYMILPIFGQLDRVDRSMLEAGRDLGGGPVSTFLRVTLPMSKQAILAGLVIVTLPMFGDYYTNDLLSGSPRTSMIGNLIDGSVVNPGRSPQGASIVVTLIVILIIPMLYYLRSTRRATEER